MHILNQVYPLKPDNLVPDESVFSKSLPESVYCQNCSSASETSFLDTIYLIEFPWSTKGILFGMKLRDNPHG